MKYRLGDICTITKGETGIMKAIPGAYTMVAIGEANKTHNEFQLDTKAVIIPLVSSTGHGHASMKRVKYQEGKFALGNILCAVTPKDDNFVLAKYLHIYLHWNREELLVSQMKGMANVSLPMNKIADVLVTVPSIAKQKAIIDLEVQLVEKELAVEKLLSDQLTQLENLNQAILQEAVQGKLVKQDPKDEPASELLKRIKAAKTKSGKKEKTLPPIKPEEIPFEIPENWVWCRLGVIWLSSFYGPRFSNSDYVDNGIPTIRTTDMTDSGEIVLTDTPMIRIDDEDKLDLYKVQDGDLLVTRSGSIGIMAIFRGNYLAIPSAYLIRFRFHEEIYPEYVFSLLKSPFWQTLMGLNSRATAQVNINATNISNFPFPLPPLSEQKRIVAEIEKQLAKTKQLKEHIISNQHATEQLLKALLHGAFEVEEMEKV